MLENSLNVLNGKKVLIFVSGSIAIYKTLEIIRILRKNGAFVRIVASKNALKFINSITFEALSGTALLCDNNESWAQDSILKSSNIPNFIESNFPDSILVAQNHIGYAKWADIALFAPISANSINKLANGIADNIYLSTALALRNIPKLIAPAANTYMLHNVTTQENLEKLKLLNYKIIESKSDILACGDKGDGAMANIDEIIFNISKEIYNFYPINILENSKNTNSKILSQFWKDKFVIVTAGGSSEDIDDIRCISNHSSGLQGVSLALALFYLGAKVTLITSKISFSLPLKIKTILAITSKDYNNTINEVIDSIESNHKIFLFMVAAISDYIPQKVSGKIKKESVGSTLNLALKENIDILKSLENRKDSKRLVKIAFKAECAAPNSKEAIANAKKALLAKNCHAICLNIINKKNKAFLQPTNEIYFIAKNIESKLQDSKNKTFIQHKLKGDKFTLSLEILSLLYTTLHIQ